MSARGLKMKRIDIPTNLSVTEAVSRIAQKIGQTSEPDFANIVSSAKTPADFQEQISKRVGSSGFISFTRLPHDKWTEKAGNKVNCYLFVLGNPNLAKPMIDL